MADNFDLQGWMREQKQGPYAGAKGVEKVALKSSKPKSKTGLNESLMGMIDLKPIGSLSEEYDETYEEDGMEEGTSGEAMYDVYLVIDGKKQKYEGGPYTKKQLSAINTSIWSRYGEDLDAVQFEKLGSETVEEGMGDDDDMDDDSTNTLDDLQLHLFNMETDYFETINFIYNNILDQTQQKAVDQMQSSGADDYDVLSYLINDVLDEGDLKQVIDHFSDLDYSMKEDMGEDDMDDAPEIEDTWNKPSEFDKDDDEEKMAAMAMKQAKSSKKGMKGVTADWTIDDILGGDDDDF